MYPRCLMLTLALFTSSLFSNAQPLYTENFDYAHGASLTAVSSWQTFSGTAGNLTIAQPGLSFSGYPSTSGNTLIINHSNSEDAKQTFSTGYTTGAVYLSILVSVTTDSGIDSEYFFGLRDGNSLKCRLHIKTVDSGGILKVQFGISAGSENAAFAPTLYDPNPAVQLVVIKYSFTSQQTSLYVFKEGDNFSTEPASPHAVASNTTTISSADELFLRQGSASQFLYADGIRMSDQWASAPLPIELTDFQVHILDRQAYIQWEVAQEEHNAGFEIQLASGHKPFETIAFVEGRGEASTPAQYTHRTAQLSAGLYRFRLKQIDFDGTSTYSSIVEANVYPEGTLTVTPPYPNPMHTRSTLHITSATSNQVTVKLYDLLGREQRTLWQGPLAAYENKILPISREELPGGIYFMRILHDHAPAQTFPLVIAD